MILLTLLASLVAFAAEGPPRVLEIVSSTELRLSALGNCQPESVMAIYGQDDRDQPLGFADVTGPTPGDPLSCQATVISHSRNALIRVDDPIRLLDLTTADDTLPGRYDLLREGRRDFSARYKPLVYVGYLFGHTAATLDKGEFLVGIGPFIYGVTDRLQIDTAPILYLQNIGQIGVKYKVIHDEDARVSVHVTGSRFFSIGRGAWTAEIQYDNASNSRSMSHTKLRYSSKQPDSVLLNNRDKEKQGSLELTTVSEWILRDWHRMLFGPKFTAGEERDLGFVASTIFVFDTWHATLNLEVNSLRKFDLKDFKQVASVDVFLRF